MSKSSLHSSLPPCQSVRRSPSLGLSWVDLGGRLCEVDDGPCMPPCQSVRRSPSLGLSSVDLGGRLCEVDDGPCQFVLRSSPSVGLMSVDSVDLVCEVKDGPGRCVVGTPPPCVDVVPTLPLRSPPPQCPSLPTSPSPASCLVDLFRGVDLAACSVDHSSASCSVDLLEPVPCPVDLFWEVEDGSTTTSPPCVDMAATLPRRSPPPPLLSLVYLFWEIEDGSTTTSPPCVDMAAALPRRSPPPPSSLTAAARSCVNSVPEGVGCCHPTVENEVEVIRWMATYNATLVNEWLCDQTSQPPAKAQLRRMAALLGWRGIADEVTKALRTLRRKTNADVSRQRCCFAKLQAGVNPFRQGKRRAPEGNHRMTEYVTRTRKTRTT